MKAVARIGGLSPKNTMASPQIWSGFAALAAAAAFSVCGHAATSGQNGTHDPSRIIESDGKFYFCSTGGRCASSKDGLVWASTGLQIPAPSWWQSVLNTGSYSGNQGIWAPDIVFHNDKYYIFYSMAGSPAAHAPCVIGVYTTPTLDAASPNYKLTDGGKVVSSPPNTTGYQFSTIDPAPIVDHSGELWTSWGSGYGKDTSQLQIFITHLDTMGVPLASEPGYKPPMTLGYGLETGDIEGSYIHYHSGYYYLFWNSGGCCSGASSTYTIHVARSATITGPYTGAKVWYASTGSIHGPGHMGVYSACGVERFTYHYYPDSGGSVLGENELQWSADGWPVVGPESTTPLVPCGDPGTGGAGSGGAAGVGGSSNSSGSGGTAAQVGSGGIGGTAAHASGGDPGSTSLAGAAAAQGGSPGNVSGGPELPSGGALVSTAGNAQLEPQGGGGGTSSAGGCSCALPGRKNSEGTSQLILIAAGLAFATLARRQR